MAYESKSALPLALHLNSRDNAIAICLLILLFTVYLFTYRGGFHSIDEVSMFSVTESMAKRGAFDTNQIAWSQWTTSQREAQGFFGQDGGVYSKKGLALSLFALPFYWLALHVPGLGMLQTVSLLNAVVTAVTGSLLYLYARRLAYSETTGIVLGLIFGLATTAWVYAKYLFSEPVAGWLLFMAGFFLLGFRQERRWLFLFGAGLAAGQAVVARANNALCLPLFGLYLLACLVERSPQGRLTLSRRWIAHLLVFAVSVMAAGSVMALYNWVRSGNALQTGYDLTIFSPALWMGLYKLLFSPLRGLFWFSPILLLSPIAFFAFYHRHRAEAALTAGIVLVNLFLFSAWTSGEGLSWGSRFLVPILPFITLPLLPLLHRILKGYRGIWWVIFVVLGWISIGVQVLGVAVNPWLHFADLHKFFSVEFLEDTPALYMPQYSPIWGQAQQILLWDVSKSDIAWLQPWGIYTGVAIIILILLIIMAFNLVRLVKSDPVSRKQFIFCPLVSAVLAILVSLLALRLYYKSDYQFGPPDDALHQALSRLEPEIHAEDGVVTLTPYHYHVFMNVFRTRQPIYGLSQMTPPLPSQAIRLLQNVTESHELIWLITSGLRPGDPNNGVEKWLAEHAFKSVDEWRDDFRLCLYVSPKDLEASKMTETPGTLFGNAIRLNEYTVSPMRQRPGEVIAVSFDWRVETGNLPNYTVFVHLVSPEGALVVQRDGEPVGGFRPTSTWIAGETIQDQHGLLLTPSLTSGEYELWAGLYDGNTGERLSVQLSDGRSDDHLVLGVIRIG